MTDWEYLEYFLCVTRLLVFLQLQCSSSDRLTVHTLLPHIILYLTHKTFCVATHIKLILVLSGCKLHNTCSSDGKGCALVSD